MADGLQFSIIGLAELNGKLASLKEDAKFKGGRFALRKAANLVAEKLRENARRVDDPQTPESIEKNVAVRWSNRTFRQTGNLAFRVGILGGAGGNLSSSALSDLPAGDTRHWRHIEFGTENQRAQPFARKSLEDNINPATDEFVSQYGKAIDRAIKRAKKKGNDA